MHGSGASKLLAVDDESLMLRDLVIEQPRGAVGLMRLPVDARRSRKAGLLINAFDQRPADTLAARGLDGEQVLQITAPAPT